MCVSFDVYQEYVELLLEDQQQQAAEQQRQIWIAEINAKMRAAAAEKRKNKIVCIDLTLE